MLRYVIALLLLSGCAVSAPSLLTCKEGQTAEVLADGGWACSDVPSPASYAQLQQRVSALEKSLGLTADGGTSGSSPSLLTQTTGPLNLYVRSDGNDATCNGLADGAASGSASNCAVASLQRAIDLVPAYVGHAVTITLGSGTFSAPSAADGGSASQVLAQIDKAGRADVGSITIAGAMDGSTTLTGSNAVAIGINIGRGSVPVILQNLTLKEFTSAGVEATGVRVTLNNVSSQQNGVWGLLCTAAASCFLTGISSFNDNFTGIFDNRGSLVQIDSEASVTTNGNSSNGLFVTNGAAFEGYGDLTVNNSGSSGILTANGSSAIFRGGTLNLSGNGAAAIEAGPSTEVLLETGANINISVPAGGGPGLQAVNNAFLSVTVANNQSLSITCASPESTAGIEGHNHSSVDLQGSGNVTISGCGTGIDSNYLAYVRDLGTGPRVESSGNEYVNNGSLYLKGGFPAATCATTVAQLCQ